MKNYLLVILLLPLTLLSQDDFEDQRDSLLSITRNQNKAKTTRGEAYISLSELYYMQNIDSMQIICSEGIKAVTLDKVKIAPETRRKLLDQKSELINNSALGFYKTGDLSEALKLWYRSLKLEEQLKDIKGQTDVLNNIGNVKIDFLQMEKATAVYQSILPLQQSIQDSAGIARTFNTLGYIERVGGNDSLAMDWYQKALELRVKINTPVGIAGSHNNIGFIYKKRGRFKEAREQYLEASRIYIKLNDDRGLIAVNHNLASCSYEMGDFSGALIFGKEGYKMSIKLKSLNDQMYLCETLSRIYETKGNNLEALKYYKEFIEIRDKLNSEKNYKALIDQELEYEFEQKEKIKELERIQEKAAADLINQAEQERSSRFKIIAIIVSSGLILVIILLYFISKQLRISRQQRVIIEKQNKEIEMKALRSQMNPHFLFNSLNSIKHFIIKNESTVAAGYLTKFAKLVRLVLENSKHNLISLQEELDCLNNYLELEKLRFEGKFDYTITADAEVYSIQVPPLILQPFIENAIWHGILNKENGLGHIDILVKDLENAIQIEITDNGIGRKKAAEIVAESSLKKKSMGLTITHERLQVLNRVIGIESKIEIIDLTDANNAAIGTKVIVYLPYHD